MKKDFIYIIIISLLGIYILGNRFNNKNTIVKEKEQIIKKAKKDFEKSTDSLIGINNKLKEDLKVEKDKPIITIPRYYEKIIYITVDDATLINSVTKSTERYRKKRK